MNLKPNEYLDAGTDDTLQLKMEDAKVGKLFENREVWKTESPSVAIGLPTALRKVPLSKVSSVLLDFPTS